MASTSVSAERCRSVAFLQRSVVRCAGWGLQRRNMNVCSSLHERTVRLKHDPLSVEYGS